MQEEHTRRYLAVDLMGEPAVEDGLLTIAEACAFLRIGRTALYEILSSGLLPSVKIGRSRRIPRRALAAFASSCMQTLV
jgi:excisionase family DNA binding protein